MLNNKGKIKSLVFSAFYKTGGFSVLRKFQQQRLTILCYHRFSKKNEVFKLDQASFDAQMYYLTKWHNIIRFDDFLTAINTGADLPPNPMILTFDDGYQDNYHFAFPVLKKYKASAMIFLATDFISNKSWLWHNLLEYILKNTLKQQFEFKLENTIKKFNVDSFEDWHATQLALYNYCRNLSNKGKNVFLKELANNLNVRIPDETTDQYQPLTWDQVREMQQGGLEFGSHTVSHPICSKLTTDELKTELMVSKKEIEFQINRQVDVFCYPNGKPEDFNDDTISMIRKTGYQASVTTILGFNSCRDEDFHKLKRISIGSLKNVKLARALTRWG